MSGEIDSNLNLANALSQCIKTCGCKCTLLIFFILELLSLKLLSQIISALKYINVIIKVNFFQYINYKKLEEASLCLKLAIHRQNIH